MRRDRLPPFDRRPRRPLTASRALLVVAVGLMSVAPAEAGLWPFLKPKWLRGKETATADAETPVASDRSAPDVATAGSPSRPSAVPLTERPLMSGQSRSLFGSDWMDPPATREAAAGPAPPKPLAVAVRPPAAAAKKAGDVASAGVEPWTIAPVSHEQSRTASRPAERAAPYANPFAEDVPVARRKPLVEQNPFAEDAAPAAQARRPVEAADRNPFSEPARGDLRLADVETTEPARAVEPSPPSTPVGDPFDSLAEQAEPAAEARQGSPNGGNPFATSTAAGEKVAGTPQRDRPRGTRQPVVIEEAPRPSAAAEIYTGLKGVCPVALRDDRRVVAPRPDLASGFEGRRYEFAAPQAKAKFDADPTRYAPALGGRDVVLAEAGATDAVGSLRYAGVYRGRIYLFQTEVTKAAFQADPQRYAVAD